MELLIFLIIIFVGIPVLFNLIVRSANIAKLKPIVLGSIQNGLSQNLITVACVRSATRQLGRVLNDGEVSKIRGIVANIAREAPPSPTPILQDDAMQYFLKESAPIMLQKNEKVVAIIPCVGLQEPRSIRTSKSTYGGPSVRVASGVYLRGGKSISHSESHEELRDIDGGDLVISNQRLVFTGPKKTINAPFKKIVSVESHDNGIILHKMGRERAQYFLLPTNLLPIKNGDETSYITGYYLRDLIEKQVGSEE